MDAKPGLPPFVIAFAGLMGLSGTALAAAGAHLGGGDLTRLAAEFLLIHAAAILGIGSLARGSGPASRLFLLSACTLGVGTALFSADLALAGLMNWHPFALAAPVGGLGLMLGWFGVLFGAILQRREAR